MQSRKLLAVVALAGAAAVVATQTGGSAPGSGAGAKGGCGVTNGEAIVDDSGSMAVTDPNVLRKSAIDLLLDKKSNATKTLGAVEFGTTAGSIFKPQPIGPNVAAMKKALNDTLHADNGSTDYNLAFSTARADNPNANGWLFLTDGGHNAGAYANGHRGLAPVMVVGLGIGPSGRGNPDADRLQQIANDTGGQYFPAQDASSLQATVNTIDAIWSCQVPPRTFKDRFTRQGQTVKHKMKVPRGVRNAEITTTYRDPRSRFDVVGIRIVRRGRIVASISLDGSAKRPPRRAKLKVTRTRGSTYVIVRVSKMIQGELQFKVKASKLGNEETVTTQVGRRT